jgi:hypothetical protein
MDDSVDEDEEDSFKDNEIKAITERFFAEE